MNGLLFLLGAGLGGWKQSRKQKHQAALTAVSAVDLFPLFPEFLGRNIWSNF